MPKRELIVHWLRERGSGFGKESGFGFALVTLHNKAVVRGALETSPTALTAMSL
jgi:hypothetical protein